MIRPGTAAAEAALVIEMWAVARILPFSIALSDFGRMIAAADCSRRSRYEGITAERIAMIAKRVTRHPWTMRDRRCLREGLLGFRFMCKAGLEPELHVSVLGNSTDVRRSQAHCWVEINGKPVLNENLPDMIPIHVYRPSAQKSSQ